jgi:hypothetical protein
MLAVQVPCKVLARNHVGTVGALDRQRTSLENNGGAAGTCSGAAKVLALYVFFQVLARDRVRAVGASSRLRFGLRMVARGACGRGVAAVRCSKGAAANVSPVGVVRLLFGTRAADSVCNPSRALLKFGGSFGHKEKSASYSVANHHLKKKKH